MIIDFHVHIFPDKIANAVITKLSKAASLHPYTNGTLSDTEKKMKEWGIDGAVFQNIATNPRQQQTINNTAAVINNEYSYYYAFGSVHPQASDVEAEVKRIKNLGIPGIKLHPEYQDFYIDDKSAYPIYEMAQQLNLPIIFHGGVDLGIQPPVHSTPDRLTIIMKNFPKLKIIAAHFGGFKCWDMVEYYLIGKNIYLDTSMTVGYLETQKMKDMILKHGTDKILFASDCPWSNPSEMVKKIEEMRFSSTDNDRIFSQNTLSVLNS